MGGESSGQGPDMKTDHQSRGLMACHSLHHCVRGDALMILARAATTLPGQQHDGGQWAATAAVPSSALISGTGHGFENGPSPQPAAFAAVTITEDRVAVRPARVSFFTL